MQYFSKISLLALALLHFSTHSMYVNNGSIVSDDCNINFGQLINNGVIKGINSIRLAASYLSGNGIIESPDIMITCNEFKFSGLISCGKECLIYAKKDFDTNMFKRSGKGIFKVIISPYDVRYFSRLDLSSTYYDYFYSNCLSLDQNLIDNTIKEIRTQAALNYIDDKVALKDIKNSLMSQGDFHKARLEEKRDMDALYSGLDKCCATAAGLGIAYALFENEQYLTTTFRAEEKFITFLSVILAGVSALPAALSCVDFYNWINPRHQEKYDAFSLIVSRINHALTTERVPEEKIIRL